MDFFIAYIRIAQSIIKLYHPRQPFHSFLKQYFSLHKKHGSRDRKYITQTCYAYFRTSATCKHLPLEEQIKVGIYLTVSDLSPWNTILPQHWIHYQKIEDRVKLLQTCDKGFSMSYIFPWEIDTSRSIDIQQWRYSFLQQPATFLRVRPYQLEKVKQILSQQAITCQWISSYSIQLEPSVLIEKIFQLDREVVVQDISSQASGELLSDIKKQTELPLDVWDCCAGSGGKSILIQDILSPSSLMVSDQRKTILTHLMQRLKTAGVLYQTIMSIDLTKSIYVDKKFSVILCDMPCSGSGTWGRTPEQLLFFDIQTVLTYHEKQKKILAQVLPFLLGRGYLLYITCSVFKKENEEIIEWLVNEKKMVLVKQEYWCGYNKRGDTLFGALLQKMV